MIATSISRWLRTSRQQLLPAGREDREREGGGGGEQTPNAVVAILDRMCFDQAWLI